MAVIDSLIATLSFDFDDKALKKFDEGMKQASKAVTIVAAGATVAGAAIFAFTSKIATQNDEIGKLSQRIGIAAQTINELGFVAQLNGGSINSMNASLENLAKTSSEAARGLGAGVEVFGLLGISVTDTNGNIKKADDLLLDVADSIAQLDSQSQKLELLNKLGIDSSLLLSLEQGSAAIRKQREEVKALGFELDKNATKQAADFNDEMLRISTIVKGVSSAIGTKLMKQITPMLKIFKEWFKANKEIIKQNLNVFFEKLTKVVTVVFNIGRRVVNVVNTLAQAFGGWANTIGVVSAALLALNIRALLIPTLILAAGAAIFLLLEDIIAFSKGAESQIGTVAEKFPIIGVQLEALIGLFKQVSKGWGLMFTDGEKALDGLIILVDRLGQRMSKWPIVEQLLAGAKGIRDLGNFLSGFNPQGGTETGIAPTFLDNIVAPAARSTTSNDVVINIQGGDISAVKQAVSEALGAEFKTAEKNLSTNIIS